MRGWIDLFENEVLMEKQDYEGMFAKYFQLLDPRVEKRDNIRQHVLAKIQETKALLRKKDRIVYYLKILRTRAIVDAPFIAQDIKNKYSSQYLEEFGETIDQSRDFTLSNLKHYLSQPIPELQTVAFAGKKPSQIIAEFAAIETEWIATRDNSGFADDESQILIDFKDGWFWVHVPRAYCSKEADAMGHCGNSPRDGSDDTILSLRRRIEADGKILWKPALTFILESDGMLGEMKGRANTKPAARYHPMIVALLKLPLIKGIRGGGYMASNNFALSDLDNKTRMELLNLKPELGDVFDYYAAIYRGPNGGNTEIMVEKINDYIKELRGNPIETIEGETVILLRTTIERWISFFEKDFRDIIEIGYGHPDNVHNLAFVAQECIWDVLVSRGLSRREEFQEEMPAWERLHAQLIAEARRKCRAAIPIKDGPFECTFVGEVVTFTCPLDFFMSQLPTQTTKPDDDNRRKFLLGLVQSSSWDSALYYDNTIDDKALFKAIVEEIYVKMDAAVMAWDRRRDAA